MAIRSLGRITLIAVLMLIGSASLATAQGFGIKFGPTFDEFSGEALDFDNRIGTHAGIFIGGSRDKIVGLQTEFNWLRKKTVLADRDIRVDYLQIPVLLRLNAGTSSASGPALYAIVGPAIEVKIADEIEGITVDDSFEGADVSLLFGAGFEVLRISIEGRYEKGLRRINNNFSDLVEIKKQSFTILFGLRFK